MSKTFDDGIVRIYRKENTADPGDKPKVGLSHYADYYFGYNPNGVSLTRATMAQSVNHTISQIIQIDADREIDENCVAEIDGVKFTIVYTQTMLDEEGLWYTLLSLERYRSND